MTRPNVLYLHSHDTGRHASPYGFAVDTPNLQRFAERGVTYRQAFCNNPTCSPSRACLLSGRYAHSNGMMGLTHRGGRLEQPERTMPAVLRDAGYETVLAGLQHVHTLEDGASMRDLGYTDELFRKRRGVDPHDWAGLDEATVEVAAGFLRRRSGGDRAGGAAAGKPFLLDVGFFATHRTPKPGAGPADEQWHNAGGSPAGDSRYARVPAPLPDTPATRADFADFAAAVARLDRYHGAILDALDAAGLQENTLVFVTTDHGLAFPHMKCNLTHHGTGVLLLMAGAGLPEGVVVDSLVSHVDLLPTVCEAAGIDTPAWAQGRTLRPALDDPQNPAAVRDAVFAEVNDHAAHEPMRSVRTARHSYIRRLDAHRPPHAVLPNIDNGPSKTRLHAAGVLDGPRPDEQLFDLFLDPSEACNVAADPRYARELAEMRARLDGWMRDTDDPALGGDPRTPGMRLHPADGYDASGPAFVQA
ncbi:sulfatase family protein [Phycisphaera mikurensis]|nr:sulfatase [Phycisphaera mikurensis]MBB6441899.1 arylsulfatase A-like enzyme [Phycisphaera mikurensis]